MSLKVNNQGKYILPQKQPMSVQPSMNKQHHHLLVQNLKVVSKKINTEPYEYTIEETGEIIEMNHRWGYVELALEMEEQIIEEKSIYSFTLCTFDILDTFKRVYQ